ncbi:peptide deformylase [candidate division WS5 bacterium]|uniref:Peptide deformylase n=1 Tax=candidate division WS5 bacterium TaxID=2093353 RepID=A0A419DCJ7_9BACT|nr:MAG: peptide deformylase [candidate division WS5 bacterium]
MKKVEILTFPNPILRKKAKEVEKIDKKVESIIERMILALESSEIEGLAIAAPQIGESIRLILVRVREQRDKDGNIIQKEIPLTAYINPEITKFSKEKTIMEEGCLSYPNHYGPVERPKKIRFEATLINGKGVKKSASGILAKIIQHEVDHLDGILFIDKLTDKSKLKKVEPKNDEKSKKQP